MDVMLKGFLCLSLILLVNNAAVSSKRTEDSPSVSIRGGGKIGGTRKIPLRRSHQALLLQVEATGGVAAPYSFLLDRKYGQCYENDFKGQGDYCNSCWAFSVKNMMQARNCKKAVDSNRAWEKVSPLNMICRMQSEGFCSLNAIGDSLGFAEDFGLVKKTSLKETLLKLPAIQEKLLRQAAKAEAAARLAAVERVKLPESGGTWSELKKWFSGLKAKLPGGRSPGIKADEKPVANPKWAEEWALATRLSDNPEALIDVSNPVMSFCDEVFSPQNNAAFLNSQANIVKTPPAFLNSPGDVDAIKSWIQNGGPVIGTIRLTWEFMNFTGSLLDKTEKTTYCRPYVKGDKDDYCSPEKRATWDDLQLKQQNERSETLWYNHFVTIHGWGVKKATVPGERDIPYWVVENSWGRQYDNDPHLGNNGAGASYDPMLGFQSVDKMKHLVNKNHFLLIADSIAGEGGLEMTSRSVYTFD